MPALDLTCPNGPSWQHLGQSPGCGGGVGCGAVLGRVGAQGCVDLGVVWKAGGRKALGSFQQSHRFPER